ncbi:MAB_1171c family putative transporter [Streptomyces sp. NPDC057199]|uniref:MAB_1171c family putative transporter n=1 Tax=Streptomyces sp. NPDC057199 TaxID=3346047 RepID=UPI0036322CC8
MNLQDLYIPYIFPALALSVALLVKLPTLIRAWKDPGLKDLKTVAGLLVLAICVFIVAMPRNLQLQNRLFGVPNVAAPITYTVLSAFSASCLALLITWRDDESPRRTRKIKWVWGAYTGVVVGLWTTFHFADMRVERLRDLDTYYATTPWAREHILLYLLAHTVSAFVASWLILTWVGRVRQLDRWLRAGLIAMLIGYIVGVGYDIAKFSAVGARWAGRNEDWLSTDVAPPFAAMCAIFIALGFVIPQAGPYLLVRRQTLASYRVLKPLWRTMNTVQPQAATAKVNWRSSLELRLMQREANISDGLLFLAPYLDDELRERVFEEALRAGHDVTTAHGIAGAADVLTAVEKFRSPDQSDDQTAVRLSEEFRDVVSIARALSTPVEVEQILHTANERV